PEIPPVCIRIPRRQNRGSLNSHSVHRRLAISLVIAGSLVLLAGCGGLASGSPGTVTAGTLSPSPSQVTFGSTKAGSNQSSTVTLSNSGGADLTITRATLSGAGFSMSNLALPLTLHAGNTTSATITFAPTGSGNFSGSVTFAATATQANSTVVLPFSGEGLAPGTLSPHPSSPGAATGTLSIVSGDSNSPLSIPLSGTGLAPGALAANPTTLAFGSVQAGNSTNLSETLTNTGGSTITISQANLTGAAFSISGLTLPLNLTANQSVT